MGVRILLKIFAITTVGSCLGILEARKCEMSCKSKETGEVVFMNQVMHDGTRCSYSEPFRVCARGECLVRLLLSH